MCSLFLYFLLVLRSICLLTCFDKEAASNGNCELRDIGGVVEVDASCVVGGDMTPDSDTAGRDSDFL